MILPPGNKRSLLQNRNHHEVVRVWSTWNDQVSNERSKIVRRVCRRCEERFQYSVLKVWIISLLGLVAQLVRAPPCHGGGRRFESDLGRLYGNIHVVGILAQLGEHLPYKQRVTGSSPVTSTCISFWCRNAGVAELADAQDLKSCCSDTVPVRFRSRARFKTASSPCKSRVWSFFHIWKFVCTCMYTA